MVLKWIVTENPDFWGLKLQKPISKLLCLKHLAVQVPGELKTASMRVEWRGQPGNISLGMKPQLHTVIFVLLVKLEELWVWIDRVQGPVDEMHCKGSTGRAFLSLN